MVPRIVFFTGVFLIVVLASGCQRAPFFYHPIYEDPEDNLSRDEFIRTFRVLDEQGNEAPAKDQNGKSPYGVLIATNASGKVGFCSLSHWGKGHVWFNEHCLELSSDPADYFVIFYDLDGGRQSAPLKEFISRGHVSKDDVTLAKIDEEIASRWDGIDARIVETERKHPESATRHMKVQMASFTPQFSRFDPFREIARRGMKFALKECQAGLMIPKLWATSRVSGTRDELVERMKTNSEVHLDENWHMFMDDCFPEVFHGNSGSLVSLAGSPNDVLGVFHWGGVIHPEFKNAYADYLYLDVYGLSRKVSADFLDREFLFNIGTRLEVLRKERADLRLGELPMLEFPLPSDK